MSGTRGGAIADFAVLQLEVTLLTIAVTNETLAPDHSRSEPAATAAIAPAGHGPDVATVLRAIIESLEDSKAEEIVSIDIAGRSSLADAMIIASGRSHRHVGAIADHLDKKLRDIGVSQIRVEGLPHCDWVLVDAGDAMVHVFRPEVRSFYNLEKIWEPEVAPPKAPARPAART